MKITRKQLRKLIRESVLHHARFETQFTNEIGNLISIAIDSEPNEPIPNSLTISMAGPDSIATNTITRIEAEQLHQLLGDYLSKTQVSIE